MICVRKIPLLCGMFFLAFCMSVPALAATRVELKVDGSKLVVTSNDSQCSGGPAGCIDVKKGTKPNMYFDLDGACGNNGPAYKLTEIRISAKNKVWPSSADPLANNIAEDFGANPNTGVIDLKKGDNNLKDARIKLKNKNGKSYSVYYEITAEPCTDMSSGKIKLDPEIKNRGRG